MLAKNSVEGKAQAFLERIEPMLEEIDNERAACAEKCKPIREDIKSIYEEAEEAGVSPKALKVRQRQLQRKITEKLDLTDAAVYEQLAAALGPLGMAAAKSAGYEPKAATAQ